MYPTANSQPAEALERERQQAFLKSYLETFQIAESELLRRFWSLRFWSASHTVECSCKVTGQESHPSRFLYWLQRPGLMRQFYRLLHHYQILASEFQFKLGLGTFNDFCDDCVQFGQVTCMAAAIDLRRDWANSRLKIYFVIINDDSRVSRAIRRADDADALRTLEWCQEWTLGFDFFLDGRTALKCYPVIRPATLNQRARLALTPHFLRLLNHCAWISSTNDKQRGRILHCRPHAPSAFIKSLPVDLGVPDQIQTPYGLASHKVFAFSDEQYREGQIRDYTLYFWLTTEASTG